MDPNLDSNNHFSNRGALSPLSANLNPKDGHTPSDNELSKECINGVKKLVESFENYTVEDFLSSFRSNYLFLKSLLLKQTSDLSLMELKTKCYDIIESFTKVDISEVNIKREFVSLCFNTIFTSSNWDEICHRILKYFLTDPKHYVNLVQVEQFFEFAGRYLNNYPNLLEKDVKRFLMFVNLLEILFSNPLFTKNFIQLLSLFKKINALSSQEHIGACHFDLIILSCRTLHIFTPSLRQSFNYMYYLNEISDHLFQFLRRTDLSTEQMGNLLNAIATFVHSGANFMMLKNVFQTENYNRFYELSLKEYPLMCTILLIFVDVVKRLEEENFTLQMFEMCNNLMSSHWLSSDFRVRELCLNLILALLQKLSRLYPALDEKGLNGVYKFSVISFFTSAGFISDLCYSKNKLNNAYLLNVKNVLNLLLEIMVANYEFLRQLKNVSRAMSVVILQSFVTTVRLVCELYYSAPGGSKSVRIDEVDDEDKNEFLSILDSSVRLLCKGLDSQVVQSNIRLVLPILVYYYLKPSRKLFLSEVCSQADFNKADCVEECRCVEGLILYVFYSFSKDYPEYFIQQYLSLLLLLIDGEDLERLFKYSFNIIYQTDYPLPPKSKSDRDVIMAKLMNENIFVGLRNSLEAVKCISYDLSQLINLLYNYYPFSQKSSIISDKPKMRDKVEFYLKLLTVIFDNINSNPNSTKAYDQVTPLSKFLHKFLFYFKLSDYNNLDLLSETAETSLIQPDENEDLYVFLLTICMKNMNLEYIKSMLRFVNYLLNYSKSRKLIKYSLMLVENYVENTNVNDLFLLLSKYIVELKCFEDEGLDSVDVVGEQVKPYFVKLLMSIVVGESGGEVERIALNIMGKLGSLMQKYKVENKIKNPNEFSLAFPCATMKDTTVVSVPVETGLESVLDRLIDFRYRGGKDLSVEEFDKFGKYLLVIMSPVLHFNTSLNQYYLSHTDKEYKGDYQVCPFNRTNKDSLTFNQMKYLSKMVKCLCLLLNVGQSLDSSVYNDLLLFKRAFINYSFLSSPAHNANNDDNLSLVIYLFLTNLNYATGCTSGSLWNDSALEILMEIFEMLVESEMNEFLNYFIHCVILKLNNNSVFRRICYFSLLLQLFDKDYGNYFKQFYNYIYNLLLVTVTDLNVMNDDLLIDKSRIMVEERVVFQMFAHLIKSDPDLMFNNLISLLNNKTLKIRLMAFEFLSEYKQQRVVQYFSNNFKNLQYLETLLLSTQYSQNKMYFYNIMTLFRCFDNGLKRMLEFINSNGRDNIEMVVYLKILENFLFDSQFEKLLKQLDKELVDQIFTTLINLAMSSSGILFNLSVGILKMMDKSLVTTSVLLTLEPYVIQLQTIFNNTIVQKLRIFYELFGNEFKHIKESLYNVATTFNESKVSSSEVKMASYFDFYKFLNKLGYSNKMTIDTFTTQDCITGPIMMNCIYRDFTLFQKNEQDKGLDLKFYDLLYFIDVDSSVLVRLNEELRNNNNLDVVYQILCFSQYLSNVKSGVVNTKEFKNVIKTLVEVSSQDVFLGHYIDPENKLQSFDYEDEKDLDELIYMIVSNKCYQVLKVHYPATVDVLHQYTFTSFSYIHNSKDDLSIFNKFVEDNLELFNDLYIFKSLSDYLYNTKLMVLLRMVHFVNNNEDLLKGNLLVELMNYLYKNVLNATFEKQQLEGSNPSTKVDEILSIWIGYYIVSKICHVSNINYMVVISLFKGYLKYVKSDEFVYLLNNLQDVPIDIMYILNNTYALTPDDDFGNLLDVDEFNNFFLVMKKIAFNFFNCLCNITVYTSSKNNQPLLTYLFQFQTLADFTNKNNFNTMTIVLSSFMSHLNNYRSIIHPHFTSFIDHLYENTLHGYYFTRFVIEAVVGMILIYESNQYQYDRFKLLLIYFRLISSLKFHLAKTDFYKDSNLTNVILSRYNGLVCKTYKLDVMKYVNYETNKLLHKNLVLKLLLNKYAQLSDVVYQVVNVPFLTLETNANLLLNLSTDGNQNSVFIQSLLDMMKNYLKSNLLFKNQPCVSNTQSNGVKDDDLDFVRLSELVNSISLFIDLLKFVNTKDHTPYLCDFLPLFIKHLYLISVNVSVDKITSLLSPNLVTFVQLSLQWIHKLDSEDETMLLKLMEILTKCDVFVVFNLISNIPFFQPFVKSTGSNVFKRDWKDKDIVDEDVDYNFFDYNGSYVEVSSDSIDKFVIDDVSMVNKKVYKITFNQIQFAFKRTSVNKLLPKPINVNFNNDNYTLDHICNILYHTRYISYNFQSCSGDELDLVKQYNSLYLSMLENMEFDSLNKDVRMSFLTHCEYLTRFYKLDLVNYYKVDENLYTSLELLFKYNQNSTTLLMMLFTLFQQDVETGLSSNYPRLQPLEHGENKRLFQYQESQVSFVCNPNNANSIKPIMNILKDFRKLTPYKSFSQEFRSFEIKSDSMEVRNEIELVMDNKLYESLNTIMEYNKVYFEKYYSLKMVQEYVLKVALMDSNVKNFVFSKIFVQLYINLSEPYRNHITHLILLFLTNKINSISVNHNFSSTLHRLNSSVVERTCDLEDFNSINLVYMAVMDSYPLITLPVEMTKYISYYIPANYFNTCYYLEKLMLSQPLEITKIATVLSDVYMKLDLVDMSIGANRCWVITNETRLALANLQHGKWKQAQREFNQIMEYLSNSGHSCETVAWFDESKVWFNYWLYCTRQLNEWDIVRDVSYISNNRLLFNTSNVYLNSFPHLILVNQNKDYMLVNQDSVGEVDSIDVENVLEMNMYSVIQRLNKVLNVNQLSQLRQYNKEYPKLWTITENCMSFLLYYYKNLGRGVSGHVNCMRMNQRVVEMSEGLEYLKRVVNGLCKSQDVNESHLMNKWRNRLPNKSDQPIIWNTLLAFRTILFSTVKNFTYLTNNQPINDMLLLNQDYVWTLVKYSGVTRKSHQLPLMASVLLNKAQKYLVSTMSKSSNIGEDYYVVINERLKQYLSFSINVPDALKSVITLDFEKLPNRGFETLKSHVTRLKAEAINRNYIYDVHQNQSNPKRPLNTIGDIDLACKYILEALKLQPLLSKNWISWAKFNDNKIDHSLVNIWSKNEQLFPLDLYETSIMGYLTAISINPNCHWLLIKRIFTLLTEVHKGINNTSESFKKYCEYVHQFVWVTWLPQLITLLYNRNNVEIFHLLKYLMAKVPQQLYYSIRAEYLSLSPQNVSTRDGEGEYVRHNTSDIKNILHILINYNSSLNHTLENFCNILTNLGKPDLIDEILCAYETIFEECLDLPFHEFIPKPMLYCMTNKILNKVTNNINMHNGTDNEDEDKELHNIVVRFTEDFIKPIKYTMENPNTQNSEFGERGLTCGYTMNKLLDVINLLVKYSKTRETSSTRRDLTNLLSFSICNLTNKIAVNNGNVIQLPHLVTNTVEDMVRSKNVIGEIVDILYIDPGLVKIKRRNHLVKCVTILTSDGQKHTYSLYPVVRTKQKNEMQFYQFSQLLNFYFKKYNETRRRNVTIPQGYLIPLDPYICLLHDDAKSFTLSHIYQKSLSLDHILLNTRPFKAKKIEHYSQGKTHTNQSGFETSLLLLILHKILLEKNITAKLYECYNKYNPTSTLNPNANPEIDRNSGFNFIYKMFKDKQYPWFITWYRKIHQDVLQDAYNRLCLVVPDDILHSYVLGSSLDYESFINYKINFTLSYATQAILSLIFASPYSTPSKITLNVINGGVRQIDFKLFNRDMEQNKLRVFRLTRNMTILMGPTCRLGLLPAVMFAISSAIHHFKIDIHAAMSAILTGTSIPKDCLKDGGVMKEKDTKMDKLDEIDEYLSKILNYCSYLRSPADQEHTNLPINNVITCIIDASTDSSMLGKLKTSYQPWF